MRLILILTVQALLSMAMVDVGITADSSPATSEQIVKGDVLMKEGDYYILKDISGHEVRVHVSPETKKDGVVKVGDKIEVTVTSDGHATSIKQQLPQLPQ